jgi:hypothetical protein
MSGHYHPKYGRFDHGDDGDPINPYADLYETKKDGLFNAEDNLETFHCKICGSRKFNVAHGYYETYIRCVVCKWESCIHSG